MEPTEAARATAHAVVYLPAGFMLDGATYEHGATLGFDGIDFYTAGRGGALGDVDGAVVAATFFFFHPQTVIDGWERSRPVMARADAAAAFAGRLHAWALTHLPDGIDYLRLAELEGRVIDEASPAGVPLFAAWRTIPEPDEPKALALHRLNVLRELRGGIHAGAVLASGLGPHEAVLVRTPQMIGLFGWPEPHPDVADRKDTWKQAEAATNAAMGTALAVLSDADRDEFVSLARAAHEGAS